MVQRVLRSNSLMTKELVLQYVIIPVCLLFSGITGILMSAAGLPVCLTRPPKLVLHPPPVSKSDIKPVPGLGHCCRKTTKKQARKGGFSAGNGLSACDLCS